jgi:acyl-CoA reductase-like NAD-dependent aldehyde dehydrogenase
MEVIRTLCFGLRLNAGATCIAPHRVFLPPRFGMNFEVKLCRAVAELGSFDVDPDVARRVHKLVMAAEADGAQKLHGLIEPGRTFRPVVLTGCRPEMALMQADLFAPVLCLKRVKDPAEALAFDAACPYALGATILGGEARATDLARRVNAGAVVVNDMIVPTADERAPFGGRGLSGFGTTRGAEGLLEMTRIKTIATRKGQKRPHLRSGSVLPEPLVDDLILADHAAGWLERWRARRRVAKALRSLERNQP